MDVSRLVIFGLIAGLLLQWRESRSSTFEYIKSAALGASGAVAGGITAIVMYATITDFSISRVLLLLVTLSGAVVLTNSLFAHTKTT